MQVHADALETLFKIFYTFACKNFLGKIADKELYGKSKASIWSNYNKDPQNLIVKPFSV